MKSRINRIIVVIIGVALGILLIYFLTMIGNKSKGPLEDMMVKIGSEITDVDQYILNSSTRERRSQEMNWIASYKNDANLLRNPQEILLGAFNNLDLEDFQSTIELEDALDVQFPIFHIYVAWGSKPDQRFPLTRVKAVHGLGSIPLITWEPWLSDFDEEESAGLRPKETRDKNGLKDIASGDYDFYLEKWTRDMKEVSEPLFIRFGHEMNDPYRYVWGPQNNSPEEFVNAWKYIHNYFERAGITNIIWVWSPHIAYGLFEEYYPGDEFVDWIGVGTLNYGTVAPWSEWWSFDEIFGNYYPLLEKFDKPIVATEFGSLAVGGDRVEWYNDALCAMPEKYPALKSVLFFHFNADNTLTYKSLDWSIMTDSLITNEIRTCIANWPDSVSIGNLRGHH